MKRIFLLIFAAVFTAALGFGQELKFDGYVNSGLGLWTSNRKDSNGDTEKPQIMAYGVDAERYLGRFRLNGAYTNEDSTAGVNFRIQVQGQGASNAYPNVPSLAFGYGWLKPIGMITIKAGLVDDSTWTTADVIYNDDQTEGAGVLVRATPIEGLDLGVGGYVASYASGSNNNFLDMSLPRQVQYNDAKWTFNAAYTMNSVFRIMVSGRTKNTTGGDAANTEPSQALAEFRLLMVDNLTAVIVGRFITLDDFGDNGQMQFFETVGYKVGDLSFGLNAAQYIRNKPSGSAAKDDISLRFNPWASYVLVEGKIVPRLDVVYFMGGDQNAQNYHRRGFSDPNFDKDTYVLNVRPSLKINVDSKTAFEIGDAFYYSKQGKNADSVMTNVFYTDITVKF